MNNVQNIHINEGQNVNISLFQKFGINIEPKFYKKFMEKLLAMVKSDCKKALAKYTLEDIIGSKSGEFFKTYLQYFDMYTPDLTITGTRHVSVLHNFLDFDSQFWISGHYIEKNMEIIKDKCKVCLIDENEEFDKAMKNLQKMSDYFLAKEIILKLKHSHDLKSYSNILAPLNQDLMYDIIRVIRPSLDFFTGSSDLKNTVQTRELDFFLAKYSKYITKEHRLVTYNKILNQIKYFGAFKFLYRTPMPNTQTEEVRVYIKGNIKLTLEAIEEKNYKSRVDIKAL